MGDRRPNVLFVVSDQERERSWLPPSVRLPWRERLHGRGRRAGQPLDPLGAVLAVAGHDDDRAATCPATRCTTTRSSRGTTASTRRSPRSGRCCATAGYRSRYIGKWHLTGGPTPADGPLRLRRLGRQRPALHGLGGHGRALRPGDRRLRGPLARRQRRPGGSVVPHRRAGEPARRDVVPDGPARLPAPTTPTSWPPPRRCSPRPGGRTARRYRPSPSTTTTSSTTSRPTSTTTCSPSRRATASGAGTSSTGWPAYIPPDDREQWRRQLDYYVRLHQLADESLGTVLGALERSGAWDDTVVVFTSDHGDMCGSHGLRSKGPFVYDEIMRVPCYVKPAAAARAAHAGGRRSELAVVARRPGPHDLRRSPASSPTPACRASTSARCWPTPTRRCATTCCSPTPRPTPRTSEPPAGRSGASSTDATSTPATTAWAAACPTTTSPGCPRRCSTAPTPPSRTRSTSGTTRHEDPHELVNLAMDNGRRNELRSRFEDLLAVEAKELVAR